MNKQNIQSFLPSRIFLIRLSILIGLLILVLSINSLYEYIKDRREQRQNRLPTKTLRVSPDITFQDIVMKDTNNNGIADWEESLWGLDPEKNGESNRVFIENKRREAQNQDGTSPSEPIDDTDRLAREFFSSFMALNQSNTLNLNAIENISINIGRQVGNTDIPNKYHIQGIKTIQTNKKNLEQYQLDLERVISSNYNFYIGEELEIMANAVEIEDEEGMDELVNISSTYQKMARELSLVKTPTQIANQHLAMVNAYDKVGSAVLSMSQAIVNPVAGTNGVVSYARHTQEIEMIIESIRKVFLENDIL
jgi:hypothetical protein